MNTYRPLSRAPRTDGAALPLPAVAGTHHRPATAGVRARERNKKMLVQGTINHTAVDRRGWSP